MKFLKRHITRQQLLTKLKGLEYTIYEEPMIYSIKYRVGQRFHDVGYFRNKRYASMLKCHFQAYLNNKTPCVLLVRFYVSPPDYIDISEKRLAAEKTPAVEAYELCDYLLSFLEMIRGILMGSYRQFVKIDAEKYYSPTPRTVFKFMHWDAYVKRDQPKDPVHPES